MIGPRCFVGRDSDLARLVESDESIGLIYGVAGIGKSELAHHAVGRWAQDPRWLAAPVLTIAASARHPAPIWTMLGTRLPRTMPTAIATDADAARDWVVGALAARPHLIVVEDAHVVAAEAAALIDALVRRGGASRIVVTSQAELPLTTSPLLVRLGPLGADDARRLARMLADRLARTNLPLDELVREAAGSPFVLRELVASWRPGPRPRTTGLAETIAHLSDPTRLALARLAAVASCPLTSQPIEDLVDDAALRALRERLLVEVLPDRVVVHEIVRAAVNATLTAAQRRATSIEVAAAARAQFVRSARPDAAVEALCLTTSAGELATAARQLPEVYPIAATAALDHLLLPSVAQLTRSGFQEVGLFEARILIRMARIDEAHAVLANLEQRAGVRGPDHHALRAFVDQRRGDLASASAHLEAALAVTPDPDQRARLALHLADVHALAGRFAARAEVLAQHAAPPPHRSAHRRWSDGLALVLAQRFDSALAVLTDAPDPPASRDDQLQIALLAILAACESGQVARARSHADALASDWGHEGLRVQQVELYLGILALTEGALLAAEAHLRRARDAMTRRGDVVFGCLAGHYLGRVLLARGHHDAAVEVLERSAATAERAGLAPLIPAGRGYLVLALVAQERLEDATALATPLATSPTGWIRTLGARGLARVAAVRGDLPRARELMATAHEAASDHPAGRGVLLIDSADVEARGGDPTTAIALAHHALALEQTTGRRLLEVQARLLAIAGRLATGRKDARARAAGELIDVRAAVTATGSATLAERLELLQLAVDEPHGGAGLADGVTTIGSSVVAGPSNLAFLRFIGLAGTRRWFHRAGQVWLGGVADVEAEVARRDLVIDLVHNQVHAGPETLHGRNALAALLAPLVVEPEPVAADALYQAAWGGTYHPLRNRNTLYIALNRTRKALRELLGDREVIRRAGSGWTLAPGIDACVVTAER